MVVANIARSLLEVRKRQLFGYSCSYGEGVRRMEVMSMMDVRSPGLPRPANLLRQDCTGAIISPMASPMAPAHSCRVNRRQYMYM